MTRVRECVTATNAQCSCMFEADCSAHSEVSGSFKFSFEASKGGGATDGAEVALSSLCGAVATANFGEVDSPLRLWKDEVAVRAPGCDAPRRSSPERYEAPLREEGVAIAIFILFCFFTQAGPVPCRCVGLRTGPSLFDEVSRRTAATASCW